MPKTRATSPGIGGRGDYTYLVEADPADPTQATVYNNVGIAVHGPGASATEIIWALANLTAARTWHEKVVTLGNFTTNASLVVYAYTILEIQGKITMANGVNDHTIKNDADADYIEIFGGWVDGNKENNTHFSTIFLSSSDYSEVHDIIVRGGDRIADRGEGIEFFYSDKGRIYATICYEAHYDNIKLRYSDACTVFGNICYTSTSSGMIQAAGCINDIIANNVLIQGGRKGVTLHGGSNCIVTGNQCSGGWTLGYNIDLLDGSDGNIIVNNRMDNALICVIIGRLAASNCDNNLCIGNYCYLRSDQMGIQINMADNTIVNENFLLGRAASALDIGIDITSNASNTRLGHDNTFIDCATCLRDAGTNTVMPTIPGQFVQNGGGALWVDGGGTPAGTPSGIDVDDDGADYAIAHIPLILRVQQVVRIKIWAYSRVVEADHMRLHIYVQGGGSSEQWDAEPVDVADHPSVTATIAVDDVVYWSIDASDDEDIGHLLGADFLEIVAMAEGAGDGDCATDALFGGILIEYV